MSRRISGRGGPSLRSLVAVGLVAIVVLAPLPVGSNRAAAWLVWTAVMAGLAALMLGQRALMPQRAAQGTLRAPELVAAALALAVWGAVQIVPGLGHDPAFWSGLPDTGTAPPATISLAPGATALAMLRIFGSALFLGLILRVAGRPDRALRMAWVIYAGIVAHAVWGLIAWRLLGDIHFWGAKTDYRGVVTGAFINRNSFATFLGMGACLGLSLMLDRGRRPQIRRAGGGWASAERLTTLLLWIGFALVILALVGTQSRMGLFATACGLALVLMLAPAGQTGRRRLWAALAGVAVLGLLAAPGVLERSLFVAGAGEARAELYRQVWQMIRARPLAGYGLDAFAPAFELFHAPPVSAQYVWDLAHSSYLTLWVEAGLVVGSLPMLAGALALRRLARRAVPGAAEGAAGALARAGLGALTLGAIHALVDFSLEMQANLFLLLALVALGLAPRRR